VQPSTLTLEQACADGLRSRHKIRPTTAAGYEFVLQPVRSELGTLAVQDLTRVPNCFHDATPTRALTIIDEVREESGQPASAKVIEPRPLRLNRDAHHLLIRRPHVAFELG
jgi:hypothetical protein